MRTWSESAHLNCLYIIEIDLPVFLGIKELSALVGTDQAAFGQAWTTYQRALNVHAQMEDHDIFVLLDGEKVGNGVIAREQIPEEHHTDHVNVGRVDAALAAMPIDVSELTAAYEGWRTFFIGHLEHEEKILPPLTGKTGTTAAERARAVYEHVIVPADKRDRGDFEFFVGWIVKQLSTHGSTANPAIVAARVFAHGLHVSSDAEQVYLAFDE